MARSGITPSDISRAFEAQNRVVDAGGIDAGVNRIRIESTGNFYSLDDIRNLTIVSRTGEHFRLADIAEIKESYQTPPSNKMRINGSPAVGIAISTVPTGNVVNMAEAVKGKIEQFSETMPEGFELQTIYDQGYESAVANQGFIWNLIISVVTVVAILLFFIGFKNGILIGSGLVFSIFATLIVMLAQGIALQRMSLAAIIIAMGMLVDNAIVVSDSALVNMQRGMRKRVAIMRACSSTALPLLAATIIAILTFLPIYYSPHITGELLSSLVVVIGVSLMFSWVFALTQTPFFIQEFVRRPRPDELKDALFAGKYYDKFRTALRWVICHRYATIGCMVVMMLLAAWSFKFIPKVFMPALDKQYFTLDVWLPEGTKIEETDRILTVLSADRGLLTMKARGVRSNRSKLKGACQLLTYAEFTVGEAHGFSSITEATALEMFPELRTDIELLALASYFAQLAEVLSQEDAASPALLPLILNALYALAKLKKPPRLVKAATELRLAALAGYLPELSGCCVCGNAEPDRFSIADGTLECASCRASDGVRMPLSSASLAAMRYIVSCPDKKLFSFTLTGSAEKELCDAAESYLLTQLERSFYTLDFYKSLLTE